MKKNSKGKLVVTGKSMWAKINSKVNIFEGDEKGYSIDIQISDEDFKELKKTANEEYAAAKANPDFINSKKKPATGWDGDPTMGCFKVDGDGNQFITLKTGHKDKDDNRKYVKVLDKYGDLYNDYENISIGNGSTVTAIFTLNVYWVHKKNHGVSLRLDGLVVNDLVTYGEVSKEDFGIEFAKKENDFDGEEIPV